MTAKKQSASRSNAPGARHGVTVLGARASGKTTLIGLLVHLIRSHRSKESDWVNSVDRQVEDYVGRLAADVEFGRFESIAATESGARWRVELELGRKGQTKPDLTLLINDVSGENIEAFLKGETDDLSLQLATDLRSAAGVLVLVDPELVYEERRRAGGDDDGLLYLLREAVRKILEGSEATVCVLFPRCTTEASEGGRIALIRSGQFIEANPSEADHGVQSIARELGRAFAKDLPWLQPGDRLGYGGYDARDPKTYSSLIGQFDMLCHNAKRRESRRRSSAALRRYAIAAAALCAILLAGTLAYANGWLKGTDPALRREAELARQEAAAAEAQRQQLAEQVQLDQMQLEADAARQQAAEAQRRQQEEVSRRAEEQRKAQVREKNREALGQAKDLTSAGIDLYNTGLDVGWLLQDDEDMHVEAWRRFKDAERCLIDIDLEDEDGEFAASVGEIRTWLASAMQAFDANWGEDAKRLKYVAEGAAY